MTKSLGTLSFLPSPQSIASLALLRRQQGRPEGSLRPWHGRRVIGEPRRPDGVGMYPRGCGSWPRSCGAWGGGSGLAPQGHSGLGRSAPTPRLRPLISGGQAGRFASSGRQLPAPLAPSAPRGQTKARAAGGGGAGRRRREEEGREPGAPAPAEPRRRRDKGCWGVAFQMEMNPASGRGWRVRWLVPFAPAVLAPRPQTLTARLEAHPSIHPWLPERQPPPPP